MKQKKFFFALSACACLLSACSTVRNAPELAALDGEWNIVEVSGSPLKDLKTEQRPFVGFQTENGKVYGNSGCNLINSTLDKNARNGRLELGQMAGTMMACADMQTERLVLDAFAQVKQYREAGEGLMALCDDKGKQVMLLEKRFAPMTFDELDGEWRIAALFGQPIEQKGEGEPRLVFDAANQKLSGHTGCNRLMGGVSLQKGNPVGIAFTSVATTRMMCPDMTLENDVLSALNSVKKYGRVDAETVEFYSVTGNSVMTLKAVKRDAGMEGTWTQPVPGMEDSRQGFVLKAGGEAQSVNMATLKYNAWERKGNTLVLKGQSIGNGQTSDFTDTFEIVSLTDKELVLKKGSLELKYTK